MLYYFLLGELIFNRKTIIKNYVVTWLISDCLANIPYGMFKAFPGKPSLDNMTNFLHFNFAYIPRFYIVCLSIKLLRIRKAPYLILHFLKKWGLNIDKIFLAVTIWTLILILHLIACLWAVAATFNITNNQNWIFDIGIQDETFFFICNQFYLTALYWASETIMTVGYGDILPQNYYEKILTCTILVVGVAMFSYTLSTLSNQFAYLTSSASKRQNKSNII